MKVSVIIPTFKPKEYLYECLDSLCNQTFDKRDFEVILILNGPSFPYEQRILNYKKTHSELQLIYQYAEEKGVSNARNKGIELSEGEFITFVDDDDFVSPDYLAELINYSNENTVALCYPLSFIDGTKSYEAFHITNCYDSLIERKRVTINDARSFFSGPVYKLIHKSIINETKFDVRLKNGEDTLFMFLISPNIAAVKFTNKKAIYYRRYRKDSASIAERDVSEHLKSNFLQLREYISSFLRKPFKYNFPFFVTRCGGSIYDIVRSLLGLFKK